MDTPEGAVVVLDNGGRVDCTVWGGILSQLAAHRGIAGTVIHGVCRDTAEAEEVAYPLYACGRFMRTGKDRVQVEAVGETVSLADVRVAAGDFIVGDEDGIVVVPKATARALAAPEATVKRRCLPSSPIVRGSLQRAAGTSSVSLGPQSWSRDMSSSSPRTSDPPPSWPDACGTSRR